MSDHNKDQMATFDSLRPQAAARLANDPTLSNEELLKRIKGDIRESVTVTVKDGGRTPPAIAGAPHNVTRTVQRIERVSMGRIVRTNGPWSNGHVEQCALVTHVYGDGLAPGTPVNLHVFIDMDQSIPVTEVPWYPTREAAMQSIAAHENVSSHCPDVCWFPERD